jgi:RNA polymerase sigma factor (sigma-70 family)
MVGRSLVARGLALGLGSSEGARAVMSPGIPTRLLATQSDERLLALVRQGHERAFEALVHRYRRPLLSYCRRLLPEARAEDTVQLALLKTWIAVREGAEIRDLKAWLYRVVHNTAVNAVRDAAHEGESLADPARRLGAAESDIDRRLNVREALAGVAALPPLQREVIVRTAVAGHSHEQVASDLGITGGAVRGLLYRARATLRTAITALTPPPLLGWLAGRADRSPPAPERLTQLVGGGGGTVGFGGLLLKGGVGVITVGSVITGAAVVHVEGSHHHRNRRALIAAVAPAGATATRSAAAQVGLGGEGDGSAGPRLHGAAHRSGRAPRGTPGAKVRAAAGRSVAVSAPRAGRAPSSAAHPLGVERGGAPDSERAVQSPPSSTGQGSSPGGVSGGNAGSGQGGESGAGQGAPVDSPATSGSAGGAGGGGSPGQGSGEAGGDAPGGGQPGAGSGSSTPEGTNSQGSASGSESSGESNGGREGSGGSGSLVGAVVHEVGSVLEHLLH